jgi:hypothetical protein
MLAEVVLAAVVHGASGEAGAEFPKITHIASASRRLQIKGERKWIS